MKKGDLIVIIVILIIASAALVGKFFIGQSFDEKRIVITKDQVVLYDMPLSENTNDEIKVEANGEYNLIVIENGIVNIFEANCDNQICVEDGEISEVGDILVCLPNKVTVEIKGEKTSEIDVISE